MIDTNEYSEAIVEVLDVIQHMDEYEIDKIPLEFIKTLNEKKSSTYKSKIDFTKSLQENELKHTTKVILTLIYRDYICTTEERKELDQLLKKTEEYKADIFEHKIEKTENELKLIPIERKKNLFQKIFDKLLRR